MRLVFSCVLGILMLSSVVGQTGRTAQPNPANDKITKVRVLLKEAKKSLMNAGKYNCCIKEACDRCALDEQTCDCATDVKAARAVCSDCYAGWQSREGQVPGVKASQVKMSTHSHKH